MIVATTAKEIRRAVTAWRAAGERVALVPTMGALHDGHVSLVELARRHATRVVASVFVNPTQFGPGEDFERYPRTPEKDAARLEEAGCDLLFLPAVDVVYPPGASTRVRVEGPSAGFEADFRPGHFEGVATVVAALFGLVRPDVAVFGEKDAQQLAVVRALVRDLHLGIEIVGAPIVREADGLAMSSRNVYLSEAERRAAPVLARSLEAVRAAVAAGERAADRLVATIRATVAAEPLVHLEYAAVVGAEDFRPRERAAGDVVVPIAARLGDTRLLDNLHLRVE
jgi:pantoate--beta-alanine ligase